MPFNKMKQIGCISGYVNKSELICLTCPMAKFTKFPCKLSNSIASEPFEMIHLDI